jgi:hypothetical protein
MRKYLGRARRRNQVRLLGAETQVPFLYGLFTSFAVRLRPNSFVLEDDRELLCPLYDLAIINPFQASQTHISLVDGSFEDGDYAFAA